MDGLTPSASRVNWPRLVTPDVCAQIIDQLPFGIWLGDPVTGEVVFANGRVAELLAVSDTASAGRPPFITFVHPDDRERVNDAVRSRVAVEHRLIDANGECHWVRHRMTVAPDELGGPALVLGIIEVLAASQASTAPPLPAAGSRLVTASLLVSHIDDLVVANDQPPSAILVLGVHDLTAMRQELGDEGVRGLTAELASRVRQTIRSEDSVAVLRPGVLGVFLSGIPNSAVAHEVSQRIQSAVEQPYVFESVRLTPVTCAGMALPHTTGESAERLLADAEIAFLQASMKGPARTIVFDGHTRTTLHRRIRLQDDLRLAVERRQIEVYYQPIFSATTDQIAGVEALARWNHPTRGFVSPAEFIPLAEDMGIIGKLDTLVMSKACHQMARWNTIAASGRELFVSVNLSAGEIVDPALVARVLAVLKKTGLSPSALKLEVTESVLVEHPELANRVMRALETRGVSFSLDDFGTGYSALSYLHKYRFRHLKIDRSFVRGMTSGMRNAALVHSIIVLARTMGMDVVAEGVETLEQLTILSEMGCDYMQGFYLARPMPGAQLDNLLSSGLLAFQRAA